MKTLLKVVGFLVLGFFVLGIIGSLMDSKPPTGAESTALATETGAAEAAPATATADLEIVKHNETADSYSRTVHVQVRNTTGELMSFATLKSVYYDAADNIVGTGIGNAANIAAGATKTIDVMAIGIEKAVRYEVEVEGTM